MTRLDTIFWRALLIIAVGFLVVFVVAWIGVLLLAT
jgi:hypothetical protein